jgi:hypothetical protein
LGGFIPLDDKQHPPLQAADMIANYTLSIGDKWLESDRSQVTKIEMQQTSISLASGKSTTSSGAQT